MRSKTLKKTKARRLGDLPAPAQGMGAGAKLLIAVGIAAGAAYFFWPRREGTAKLSIASLVNEGSGLVNLVIYNRTDHPLTIGDMVVGIQYPGGASGGSFPFFSLAPKQTKTIPILLGSNASEVMVKWKENMQDNSANLKLT